MSPSSQDVAVAVGRTRQHLPQLAVVITPRTGRGPSWMVDANTDTIYIADDEPCRWAANALDALADLTIRRGVRSPAQPALRLIQGGVDDEPEHRRTGTDDLRP